MYAIRSYYEIAREEGFKEIADTFESIAIAERYHENRYLEFCKNIEKNEVFKRGGRITSYNVCYTKLLRNDEAQKIIEELGKLKAEIPQLETELEAAQAKIDEYLVVIPNFIVITSYSIHYTKLYDWHQRFSFLFNKDDQGDFSVWILMSVWTVIASVLLVYYFIEKL